jgi:UDP-3-O-[3-hydroxymyristoyl] N-acetylglucosamine deacetylase
VCIRMINRMINKKTIRKQVHLSGTGVHSGKNVDLWICPSESGKILFQRKDRENASVELDIGKIQSMHSSSLISGDIKIRTIEHLMAVLFVYGINSVLIKLDEEEIPFFDGSAVAFSETVDKAGTRTLNMKTRSISIKKPFRIKEDKASICGTPDDDFKITYIIEYDHPCIGRQELSLKINRDTFRKEIAPARTFGFLKDAEKLRKKKLALGSSFDNTIVLDDEKVVNGPLRFQDEFVRHKILDFIGDLSLLNGKLSGHFKAERAGHSLHLKAFRFLAENKEFCEIA